MQTCHNMCMKNRDAFNKPLMAVLNYYVKLLSMRRKYGSIIGFLVQCHFIFLNVYIYIYIYILNAWLYTCTGYVEL